MSMSKIADLGASQAFYDEQGSLVLTKIEEDESPNFEDIYEKLLDELGGEPFMLLSITDNLNVRAVQRMHLLSLNKYGEPISLGDTPAYSLYCPMKPDTRPEHSLAADPCEAITQNRYFPSFRQRFLSADWTATEYGKNEKH